MPDGIQPVGAMIQPPDPNRGISTLSGILGLRQQQQQLQTGQYNQQTAQATAQMTQQDAQNRAAAGSFFKSFDIAKHHGDDGTLDLDSALTSPEFKATGDSAPEIAKSLLAIKNSQLAAKTSLAGLNKELRSQFSSQVAGLAQDPDVKEGNQTGRGKVLDAITQFGQAGGPDAQRVAGVYSRVLQNTPPEKMGQALQNLQLQAKSAGEQLPTPTVINTGTQQIPGAVAPGTGAVTPAGPSFNTSSVATTPGGSLATITPATGRVAPLGGTGTAAPGGPRTADQDAPPPNAPRAAQENYLAAATAARDHVAQVREADNDYGTNVALSNTIRKLSANTATGPGTEVWHHALGAIGAPVGANNVADYQLIGAYLDRQAALVRRQMGLPGTNEGSATSQQIAGNVQYQQKALQDKNDLNQALAEGLHAYRNGLDRVEGFTGNPSPKSIQQFKSAWTNNFDPNVFRLENAQKRIQEDPEAVKKVLSELSPAEAASLRQKRQNLKALMQGQIPP